MRSCSDLGDGDRRAGDDLRALAGVAFEEHLQRRRRRGARRRNTSDSRSGRRRGLPTTPPAAGGVSAVDASKFRCCWRRARNDALRFSSRFTGSGRNAQRAADELEAALLGHVHLNPFRPERAVEFVALA